MLALLALLATPALAQDVDGDGYAVPYDCDDADPSVHPGAPDPCDGVDSDCDGRAEDPSQYRDFDGDGIIDGCDDDDDGDGDPDDRDCQPLDPSIGSCDTATDTGVRDFDGDGYNENVDCNDYQPTWFPGAPERCDTHDNDCDGIAEATTDNDGDGVWDDCEDNDGDGIFASEDCDDQDARVGEDCTLDQDGDGFDVTEDCNDLIHWIYPGAPEFCDGLDTDCDGIAESAVDRDGDGVRDDCDDTDGDGVLRSEDCDDTNATIGQDDPCVPADDDGDGYAGDDCDDTDPAVHPGAQEDCATEVDDDCDGLRDDCESGDTGPADRDGDGYPEGVDCDDGDGLVHPGAEERCGNGLDEDCDGLDSPCDTGVGSTAVDTGVGDTGVDTEVGDTGVEDEGKMGCGPGRACSGTGGTYSLLLVLPFGLWRRRRP